VQSRGAETVSEPEPPPAANVVGDPAAVTWHFAVVGAVTDVSDAVQAAQAVMPRAADAAHRRDVPARIEPCRCTRLASRAGKNFSQD